MRYICKQIIYTMSQASISIRVDKDLKQSFYALCEDFGLSAATAFNIYMKAVVRERKIPFEISSDTEDEKRQKLKVNLQSIRTKLADAGLEEMSLDEINAEIKAVRDAARK